MIDRRCRREKRIEERGAWPHLGLDISEVRPLVARIRERTSRPFGAGFICHRLHEHREHLDVSYCGSAR
jgi:hypothetical protein